MKGLALILGKGKPAASSSDDEEEAPESKPGSGMKSEYETAAKDAAKSGDLEALADALMGYARCCGDSEEE